MWKATIKDNGKTIMTKEMSDRQLLVSYLAGSVEFELTGVGNQKLTIEIKEV